MTLKEATQNIVQQFSCIDRLQIESRFPTRFETQYSLREETIWTIAVDAETTGAVDKVGTEFEFEKVEKIRIGNLSIVTTKVRPGALTLDLDASERRFTEKTVVACERQQARDARLRQETSFC